MTVLGGAGSLADIGELIRACGVVGAAAGSLFVFKGAYRAVLISYPDQAQKEELCSLRCLSADEGSHLSQYFWPETFRINGSRSRCVSGLRGQHLTGQPNYPDGRGVPRVSRAVDAARELRRACDAHRVPLVPRGNGGALRLCRNYLSFLRRRALLGPWLLRGQPLRRHFRLRHLAASCRRFRASVVTPARPAARWSRGSRTSGRRASRRPASCADRACCAPSAGWCAGSIRNSDLLLPSRWASSSRSQALAGGTPVEYHPNPGERSSHRSPPDRRRAPRLGRGFNVVFAGNLGTRQALDTMRSGSRAAARRAGHSLRVGWQRKPRTWLRERGVVRGLTNVQLARPLPARGRCLEFFAQASALLVTLVRDPVTSQTVPSKVQSYLAAGRPIIASLDGEGVRVVEESGEVSRALADDRHGAGAALFEDLASLSDAGACGLGENGREYYAQHFEPTMLAERLRQRFGARGPRAEERSMADNRRSPGRWRVRDAGAVPCCVCLPIALVIETWGTVRSTLRVQSFRQRCAIVHWSGWMST